MHMYAKIIMFGLLVSNIAYGTCKYTVYLSGDMFDHKHLIGNTILADRIKNSSNKYDFILPQDQPTTLTHYVDIRNYDILSIIRSDFLLVNFDGTDLDSGTVVEYIIAKMLDIPCVLLRTDFRCSSEGDSDQWNLMCSSYPRSAQVVVNSLDLYKTLGFDGMYDYLTQEIKNGFCTALNQKCVFNSADEIVQAYSWVINCCGSKLAELISKEEIADLVESKIEKGIYKIIK